jgi:signal transduction histidine kinase
MLVRVRLRQLATRMRDRIEQRVAERERIARELHDTLLQSVQALILRVHAASRQLAARGPTGDPAVELLETALRQADEVMAEARDRVLELRTPAAVFGDLPNALTALGEELAAMHGTTFRSITEGTLRALAPDVKEEAYRIGREALLNAFRHALADSVETQFIYAGSELRVRIRDDGVGIDAAVVESGTRPGHWGLTGMRERAEKIGATLDLWSRAGAGTEIELTIPASIAYQHDPVSGRWQLFRQRLQEFFQTRPQSE